MNRKIGILGAGRIAHKMAATVSQMNGCEIAAVASLTPGNAQKFALQYDIARAYTNYEALVCDPDVELIYVATPHSLHYAHVRLCLEAGKAVLCEKTLTTTAREAKALFQLAQEKRVYLAEAIWTRYMPLSHTISQLLSEGAIGEPHMLSANLCYPVLNKERVARADLGGGALLDIGTYVLHFAAMAFGTKVEQTVSTCTMGDTGVDLQESIVQHFSNHRMAVLHSSILCRSDRNGCIAGSKGYMTIENINCPSAVRVYNDYGELLAEHIAPPMISGFEYEITEAFRCIDNGAIESSHIPHAESLRILQIMDALRKDWGMAFPADQQTF